MSDFNYRVVSDKPTSERRERLLGKRNKEIDNFFEDASGIKKSKLDNEEWLHNYSALEETKPFLSLHSQVFAPVSLSFLNQSNTKNTSNIQKKSIEQLKRLGTTSKTNYDDKENQINTSKPKTLPQVTTQQAAVPSKKVTTRKAVVVKPAFEVFKDEEEEEFVPNDPPKKASPKRTKRTTTKRVAKPKPAEPVQTAARKKASPKRAVTPTKKKAAAPVIKQEEEIYEEDPFSLRKPKRALKAAVKVEKTVENKENIQNAQIKQEKSPRVTEEREKEFLDARSLFPYEGKEIFDGVFVGGEMVAKNRELLDERQIRGVVNATKELQNFFEDDEEFSYFKIPLPDSIEAQLIKFFDDSSAFIAKQLAEQKNVLVHCKMGQSRSPSVIIACTHSFFSLLFFQSQILIFLLPRWNQRTWHDAAGGLGPHFEHPLQFEGE